MEKKLPKIYANRIDKDINNNDKVAYSRSDQFREVKEEVNEESTTLNFEKSINQKISDIFNSPRYVYKADVDITLKDKKIKVKLVGKNNNKLITLDNELIPIDDIIDIKFSQ